MNRVLGHSRPLFKCKECGREVFATRDGYLPRHRPPKRRALCDASESSITFHRKVTM